MLTKILISIIVGIFDATHQALLKLLLSLNSRSLQGPTLHSPTFSISTSVKSLVFAISNTIPWATVVRTFAQTMPP